MINGAALEAAHRDAAAQAALIASAAAEADAAARADAAAGDPAVMQQGVGTGSAEQPPATQAP